VTDDEELIALRVDEALWIVHRLARTFATPRLERGDLVSVGYLALRAAAAQFDASRGKAWTSWAFDRVKWAMLDERRKLSVDAARTIRAGHEALGCLRASGRARGAGTAGAEEANVDDVMEYFGAIAAGMHAGFVSQFSAAAINAEAQLATNEAVGTLRAAIVELEPEHARIMEARIDEAVSLQTLAERFQIPYGRMKRRHEHALRALARAMARRDAGE
jgi:RNA polymerase sigma factor (sigma-70 family)